MEIEKFHYDNKVVKYFCYSNSNLGGAIGMLVGLLAATQLFAPEANLGSEYTLLVELGLCTLMPLFLHFCG